MGLDTLAVAATSPAATPTSGKAVAATALAPGFRFHPTDEELVSYYLKRKVLCKPVRFSAIGEVDIYKHEPWELAGYSRLKTRDQEWYFYSALDKKYGNGARMNRATNKGYWKATGKDREIRRDSQLIGMKKTLVFHSGRAPDGLRTNWVMHEYRLIDWEMERNESAQDAYVLCRVFHKNNIGPPSGNRYAPFMEEEWDDAAGGMIPGEDVREPLAPTEDANVTNEMEQEQELQSVSKDLININELPRESQIDHDHPKDDSRNKELKASESALHSCKREKAEHPEECPPLCVLNKEAPLPLLQYKRRRQNEMGASNNSSRATQDHCSSTTTEDTITTSATTTAISALLEFSLMGSAQQKEKPRFGAGTSETPNLETTMPASCVKLITDLEKEIHQMSVERETLKLEMMRAEAMISILQSKIEALHEENKGLKESIRSATN